MPDTLNNYVLQERPIVPMVDLGILSNSLATINQGNKEALKTQSELKAAIGNIDLNEAEDGYKEQLYNDIEKTVEDNSIEGNAYFALDDLIAKKGDIQSNEGLLGRIKAQEAYKKNIADLDERVKRGDITRDTAEWAKEMNPYHYEDKYKTDVDGNVVLGKDGKPVIIGGTDWTPDLVPVKDVDINQVYSIVKQYIKPKKSNINETTFVDSEGNIVKQWDPNKRLYALNTVNGHKEEVTRKMVDEALEAAVRANPEIEASIKQSWNVAKWKYSKGDTINNLAYDSSGREKSYNQYRNDLLDPYINSMINSYTESKTSWNDAGLTAYYKARAAKQQEAVNIEQAIADAKSRPGHSIILDTDIFGSAAGKINEGKSKLSALSNISKDDIPDTYEDFVRLYDSYNGPKTQEQINNDKSILNYAKTFYDTYSAELNNNKNRLNSNSKLDAASIADQYLKQNIPLSSLKGNNPYLSKYSSEYSNFINNLFAGKQSIKFVPNDINKVIKSNTEKQRYLDMGFRIENNAIILDKDKDYLSYTFANLLENQKGDVYREEDKLTGGNLKGVFNFLMGTTGDSQLDWDADILHPNDIYEKAEVLYNKINEEYQDFKINRVVNGDDKVEIGTGALASFNLSDMIANQLLEETGEDSYKRIAQRAAQRTIDLAKSGNLVDIELYQAIDDGNGNYHYKELDRNEKLKITNELSGIDSKDITGNLSYLQGYEFKQGIVYPRQISTAKDGVPAKYEAVKLIYSVNDNDPDLEALNNTDMIRTAKELMGAYINEESITAGKIGDNYIYITGINNPNDIKFSNTFNISIGGDPSDKFVDLETAMSLISSYRVLLGKRNTVIDFKNENKLTEDEAVDSYIKSYPESYNKYSILYGEQTARNILKDIFFK